MHYVIGDVHGCYDELIRLLEKINIDDPEAIIIFTGDFIDRGPEVVKTLKWFMQNVTTDGKYRSILGNHEDMVIKYWNEIKDYWVSDSLCEPEQLPKLRYGLDDRLKEVGLFTRSYFEKVVFFLESLPLRIDLTITFSSGKTHRFVVAHAYIPSPEVMDDPRETYLWSRKHYWGYNSLADHTLVHGHTPTIDFDYLLRNQACRPGMINYSPNCINVDSGCCYHYTWQGSDYPCFLSALCLETFEEIYSHTIEERFEEYLVRTGDGLYHLDKEMGINFKVEPYWENLKNCGYKIGDEFYYRDELIKNCADRK